MTETLTTVRLRADQRFYTSQFGRFTSADRFKQAAKVNDSGSWNKYSYTRGDPVNRLDPFGRCDINTDTERSVTVCADPPCTGEEQFDSSCPAEGGGTGGGGGSGGSGGSGGGGTTSGAQQISNAVAGASDRIFRTDCAGLFLSPDNNTASNRQGLSIELESLLSGNVIRQIDPSGLPSGTPNNIPAFTTGTDGFIYLVSGGAFFTGTVNGNSLGGFASGMSLSNFDQLVILHEFLHYIGVAGADSKGQTITLPNGDKVTGSQGISQEIKQKCF